MRTPSRAQQRRLPSPRARALVLGGVLLVGAAWWGCARADEIATVAAEADARVRLSSAQVQQAFRHMDRDGNGRIDRAEVSAFPRIERFFDKMDSNRDGVLSPAEFEDALQQSS